MQNSAGLAPIVRQTTVALLLLATWFAWPVHAAVMLAERGIEMATECDRNGWLFLPEDLVVEDQVYRVEHDRLA